MNFKDMCKQAGNFACHDSEEGELLNWQLQGLDGQKDEAQMKRTGQELRVIE